MKNYSFLFLILFITYVSYSQNKSLELILKQADSIQIASHEDLSILTQIPGKSEQIIRPIVINGIPNNEIIKERLTIDQSSRLKLTDFLINTKDNYSFDLSCFEPHHSIFIFKRGICSYIDICFGCRHYTASSELKLNDTFLISDEDWNWLEDFFKNQNIIYKMPKR